MITVKGVYRNGEVHLDSPSEGLPAKADLILNFPDQGGNKVYFTHRFPQNGLARGQRLSARQPLVGRIWVMDQAQTSQVLYQYPLLDRSFGGISFLSDRLFVEDGTITLAIVNPAQEGEVLMELEVEVRAVEPVEAGYKVGCMFLNSLDEGVFHGLIQTLGLH
ncbi:MAG: hypothetical protein A2600_04065 [Candidatus Lambdaproteobacteria bacterium RIFOXYD1_FULL_56_27]|uniref:PilZ domain-containing protein n=1 Tax=Candidatus Lambdaproteobacteria bacterium RIFOXYD2_FULL_56_26 TaxID=1817773 RepID=A0A1F6H3I8_9PROT|nr:MAG: hypothetical protein A2426_01865 [Candidatus Lambdaproteobacteria bacterium RIFOXYC1_FULL_56_13]OGH04932.1 MAG: hypothetical protein A2557_08130 [Candidatus Lambdaproteobacteria bacterium RIFOXYD2_FULL_56_26]OGH09397.1 MAG: hypothetical protein A2600_04065 [Candidatus Lambdaproteobacteria bacterium RIFOXYD1_FULL_56_27]